MNERKVIKSYLKCALIILMIISIPFVCSALKTGIYILCGKYVYYNGEIYSKDITELRIWEDRNLRNIKKFSDLKKVTIGSSWNMHLDSLDFLEGSDLDEVVIIMQDIKDWSALGNLKSLKSLTVYSSNLPDLEVLGGLENLEYLEADDCNISSLSGIENLERLTYLSLHYNDLTDIDVIDSVKGLKELSLSANPIADIEKLTAMNELNYLSIYDTDVNAADSVKYIMEMPNIEKVAVNEGY